AGRTPRARAHRGARRQDLERSRLRRAALVRAQRRGGGVLPAPRARIAGQRTTPVRHLHSFLGAPVRPSLPQDLKEIAVPIRPERYRLEVRLANLCCRAEAWKRKELRA